MTRTVQHSPQSRQGLAWQRRNQCNDKHCVIRDEHAVINVCTIIISLGVRALTGRHHSVRGDNRIGGSLRLRESRLRVNNLRGTRGIV
eukprot:50181-Eustigmatos_ZCMA.PRE.1